jgi:hypothetical protein
MSDDILQEFEDAFNNLKQKASNKNIPNGKTLTCQNTGESLKNKPRFATNIVVPTPIYNMRVTID